MWIEIINGPNLARIGQREPSIYGTMSMDTCLEQLHQRYDHQLRLTYFQSNHEGALLDRLYELHDAGADAIILNAGAYTHTSLALADALRAITPPLSKSIYPISISVSLSAQRSLIAEACRGTISGFGLDGYRLAIEAACGGLPLPTHE